MKFLLPMLLAASVSGEGERWLTLGAAVSETVAVLGFEEKIVAVDTTTRWPKGLSDRPRVGYLRTLSAEGLIAMRPTRVLASEAAGPAAAMEAVQTAGVKIERFAEAKNWKDARTRILAIGRAVGSIEPSKTLVESIDQDLQQLENALHKRTRPKILFVFAHGRGPVIAGQGTVAETMIKLAGGRLALPDFKGYKPPSTESLAVAAPDFILTTPSVLKRNGGQKGLLSQPAIAGTPAAQRKAVVVLDGAFLLGLGPRTADAAWALATRIHPGLVRPAQ